MTSSLDRRQFLSWGAAATAFLSRPADAIGRPARPPAYSGPNVVLVRFGGGVRRRETIDARHTFAPFLRHDLVRRGVLFENMEIGELAGAGDARRQVETSHGQGTLHLLTGRYDGFVNRSQGFLDEDFEPTVPTLFEYLRKAYDVPQSQTLIVNHEDRPTEEFFTSSRHHGYGIRYRSDTLSLYRYKRYLRDHGGDADALDLGGKDEEFEAVARGREDLAVQDPAVLELWARWRRDFRGTGLVNPRGDRALTELAVRALRELRPRLMMVNYQDCDYVHWGNPHHYSRGIAVIDQGLRRLCDTVENDPEYAGNTVFVVVPDCGRDDNRLISVPYQHHFTSRSSREVWALFAGPGIARDAVVDRTVEQVSVAHTIARVMGFEAEHADGECLEEAFV